MLGIEVALGGSAEATLLLLGAKERRLLGQRLKVETGSRAGLWGYSGRQGTLHSAQTRGKDSGSPQQVGLDHRRPDSISDKRWGMGDSGS